MFEIELMINNSPVEKIGKDLESGASYSCVLKDGSSVLNPVLILEAGADVVIYNYMHIEEFGRYYFIDDIVSLNNNRWQISGHVDPLETYKDAILSNSAILEGTERTQINKYLNDPDVFITNCKHLTNIVNFPAGLLDTGEFILITAGG